MMPSTFLYVTEVREVAGIGQLVDVYDMIVRIFRDEKTHDMRADESGSSGNDDRSLVHMQTIFVVLLQGPGGTDRIDS